MTYRVRVAAVLAALSLAGCAGESAASKPPSAWEAEQAAKSSPTPATAADDATRIECVNIERAYSAWSSRHDANIGRLNKVSMQALQDAGESLLNDVQGYADQPSKELATAVAGYNYQLALGNVEMVISGSPKPETAEAINTATQGITTAFTAFKAATCK